MPPNEDNPTPENDGNPAPQPGSGQPPKPASEWESSYKGLQKTYDKLFAEHQALVAKHESTIGELEALKADKRQGDSSVTSLRQELVSKDTEIERLKKEAQSSDKKANRSTLILRDFSDLAQFEGEGLLPDAETEDELKAKLTKFRETVGKTIDSGVDRKIKGAGPPPVGRQEPPKLSSDEIYDRLVQLAGSQDPKDQAEYLQLHRQWIELQKS